MWNNMTSEEPSPRGQSAMMGYLRQFAVSNVTKKVWHG